MEQTRNKEDAMRKNMRQKTQKKRGFKNQRPQFVFKKKLTIEDFEFVWARNRYVDEEKTGKEEGRKEE